MGYASPWEQGHQKALAEVDAHSEITLSFSKEPLSESLSIELWTSETETAEVLFEKGRITAPSEPGVYVYHFYASWEQGSRSFAFPIKVN
ncbi:hypothetical protein ACSFXN_09385 [Planococcus sp. 1R117A]|uniref:hypothetical protein n=1 Tax=Planococcus sp. 1R117A TaxID=3447020 RepID=UPI003EDB7235